MHLLGLQARGNPAGGEGSSHNVLVSLHGNQWLTGLHSKQPAGRGLVTVCTWPGVPLNAVPCRQTLDGIMAGHGV